jgi:FAD synthetase
MWQKYKKKIILTFGTFDRLHPGHQYYLSQARWYGDYLITIVARDSTVSKVKGRLPYYDEQARLSALQDTWRSDEVILGHESGFDRCLWYYKPDVICLWYDQGDITGTLDMIGSTVKVIRILPYQPDIWKSSLLW